MSRRTRWRVAAGAAIVVLVGVGAFVLSRPGDDARLLAAERAALEVATQRAEQLTTYRPETFAADVAWAEDGATVSFAREYAAANEPLGEVVQELGASAQGSVDDAAATARTPEAVDVLLFVDQTIRQDADGEERTERNRVRMSLVRVGDDWLVDDVSLR